MRSPNEMQTSSFIRESRNNAASFSA